MRDTIKTEDYLCIVWWMDVYVSQTLQMFIEIVQKVFQKIEYGEFHSGYH